MFALAGVYNLLWGLFAGLRPQWYFDFSGLPRLNHPSIFSCVGMVVGVYGLLYLEVVRRPEHGWPIAAVGLLGKVLGPIGLLVMIATRKWPPASIVLCITNDFMWWPAFALYLYDGWPWYRSTWDTQASPPSPSSE